MMNMVLCHTVVVDVADDNDDEENSKKEEKDLSQVPEDQLLYKGIGCYGNQGNGIRTISR